MAIVDYILFGNAVIFSLFAMPHLLKDDGGIADMGWDVPSFMPKKGKTPYPVPTEISMLQSHLCAIIGASQAALVIMCLLAATSGSKSAKFAALKVMSVYSILLFAMQFHRPSGTGAEGSPASGPLPVLVAIAVPNLYGVVMGMVA